MKARISRKAEQGLTEGVHGAVMPHESCLVISVGLKFIQLHVDCAAGGSQAPKRGQATVKRVAKPLGAPLNDLDTPPRNPRCLRTPAFQQGRGHGGERGCKSSTSQDGSAEKDQLETQKCWLSSVQHTGPISGSATVSPPEPLCGPKLVCTTRTGSGRAAPSPPRMATNLPFPEPPAAPSTFTAAASLPAVAPRPPGRAVGGDDGPNEGRHTLNPKLLRSRALVNEQ